MRLTRRDALATLAGGVGTSAATLAASEATVRTTGDSGEGLTEDHVRTLAALAAVVYPTEVEVTTGFVDTYVGTFGAERRRRTGDAVDGLDEYADRRLGSPFAELPRRRRETVLRDMQVHRVPSTADGTLPERVRYLVNGLLYALFTHPKGSRLAGIDNPVGHPGGFDSYQDPPA